jgi:hypothetical protein
MFRIFLATSVVAIATVSAQAAITVDGDTADWGDLLRYNTTDGLAPAPDNSNVKTYPGDQNLHILRYGAAVIGPTLYTVMEIDRPIKDFNDTDGYMLPTGTDWGSKFGPPELQTGGILWNSIFIDADNNAATGLSGNTAIVPGSDINFEWGRNTTEGSAGQNVNFWGYHNNIGAAIPGGASGELHVDSGMATTNGVIEMSVPVKSIIDALAETNNSPYAAPSGFSQWAVNVTGQGTIEAIPGPITTNWAYDFPAPIVLTPVITGDADISGTVNVADLTKLLNNYNQTGKAWTDGDFNGDGTVNVADLTALLNNYNKTNGALAAALSSSTPVPEPSSIVLLAILSALIGAWVIRRRS